MFQQISSGPPLIRYSEKNDLSLRVVRSGSFCQSLQIANAAANGEVQLPGKDNRGKGFTLALAPDGFRDQIFILTEQDASEFPARRSNSGSESRVV